MTTTLDSRVKWTNVFQLIEPQCATLQSFPSPFPPKIDQKEKQNCFCDEKRFRSFDALEGGSNKEIIIIVIIINEKCWQKSSRSLLHQHTEAR